MKKMLAGSFATLLLVLAGCASSMAPGVGAWNISMATPVGEMPAVLTMNADGSGTMAADGLGETSLNGIMYDGNMIKFSADIDAQGQTLTLTFSGSVDGNALTGEFGSDFGAFGVTGTRQ